MYIVKVQPRESLLLQVGQKQEEHFQGVSISAHRVGACSAKVLLMVLKEALCQRQQ